MKQDEDVQLVAVASRSRESAEAFARHHGVPIPCDHWEQLVSDHGVEAVYISTPTAVREEIAIAAAQHIKHILADKPFTNLSSVQRIIQATKDAGVAFMDGPHFVHHPRTNEIRAALGDLVGEVQAIRTCFFFPFMDRANIRFNTEKEPTGAVGDMAWYAMRAIVAYMPDRGELKTIHATAHRDGETGAVIRGAGAALFEGGKTSTTPKATLIYQ